MRSKKNTKKSPKKIGWKERVFAAVARLGDATAYEVYEELDRQGLMPFTSSPSSAFSALARDGILVPTGEQRCGTGNKMMYGKPIGLVFKCNPTSLMVFERDFPELLGGAR